MVFLVGFDFASTTCSIRFVRFDLIGRLARFDLLGITSSVRRTFSVGTALAVQMTSAFLTAPPPEICFWVGYRFSAAALQTENYFDFTVEERAFRPASEVRDESGL